MQSIEQTPLRDPASFRDPSGYVFRAGTQIYRTVNPAGYDDFELVRKTGVIDALVQEKLLIRTEMLTPQECNLNSFTGARGEVPRLLLRHPFIPFISHPYEWTFSQLQDAALAQLDLQICALDHGVILSDASPYNMQFFEDAVLHIDVLSLKPYVEGQAWHGYHQFCRLFLLPLLIESWRGIPFQTFLRGGLEGVAIPDAARLLPRWRVWTSLNGIIHVIVQSRLVAGNDSTKRHKRNKPVANLPMPRYRALLTEMRRWTSGLRSGRRDSSFWGRYAKRNTYSDSQSNMKKAFVTRWANESGVSSVWDIGGNTGVYAEAALRGGAGLAVILDSDLDSLEAAFLKRKQGVNLLPIVMDIADPSPSLGWNQRERGGLDQRSRPDGVIALAVLHHLVIGRNLPLSEVLHWIISLAATGIIEFVPKNDPMVVEMLLGRDDIFQDYNEDSFRRIIGECTSSCEELRLGDEGRLMLAFSHNRAKGADLKLDG